MSKPLKKVMKTVETKANQAPHGWKGALYGRSSLEIPCTFRAFMNRLRNELISFRSRSEARISYMWEYKMDSHVRAPKVDTRFTNHPNTDKSFRAAFEVRQCLTFSTRRRNVQEDKATKCCTQQQSWQWNPSVCHFPEDSRSFAFHCQTI